MLGAQYKKRPVKTGLFNFRALLEIQIFGMKC